MTKIVVIISIALLCAVFFYRLGNSALTSYDEAWYAEIARNIVIEKNPWHLTFNGSPFTDHPPFGYWLMAVTTLILGSNEFSARFVSATLGMLSIVLMYIIGTRLKSKTVGISAAAILLSSLWFMLRARSGNLDIPFVFWQLMVVFSLLKVKDNSRYLYLASFSFAALILTKTLVGIGILPVFVYLLWVNRRYLSQRLIILNILVWLILVLPWYISMQLRDHSFLQHHFVEIGTRSNKNGFELTALKQSLFYIQVGIGKWFKVFLLSAVTSVFLWLKVRSNRQSFITVWLLLLGFAVPFLLSSQTEIWHLIPVYPGIALLIAVTVEMMVSMVRPKIQFSPWLVMLGIVLLAGYQFKQLTNLIYPTATPFSTEKDIAIKAGQYSPIYLMETFYPATVYYSQQRVVPFHWQKNAYQEMATLLNAENTNVFIINNQLKQQLESDQVPFQILESNQSYYIIQ